MKYAAVKICERCGKTFTPRGTVDKYCSDDCRYAVQKERSRTYNRNYKAKKKAPKPEQKRSIGEIALAAKKAGMSYGEYVAKFGV